MYAAAPFLLAPEQLALFEAVPGARGQASGGAGCGRRQAESRGRAERNKILATNFRDRPRFNPVLITSVASLLRAGQCKVHRDVRFYFDRLAVQNIWLILPLLYRLNSRGGQHGVAAHDFKILNFSSLADEGAQKH